MVLLSLKKEESFVYLKNSSPNWRHPPFSSSFGGGEKGLPVSFAGGEIQFPVSRITRRFDRDKLSVLLCTYYKLWITDVIGNDCFGLPSVWIWSRESLRAYRYTWFVGHLVWCGSCDCGGRQKRALLLILDEKGNQFLGSFLIIMHFHLGMVNIYHECFLIPNTYYETLQTHCKFVRILEWVPVYLLPRMLSLTVCFACFIMFLFICLSYSSVNLYYYFWVYFNMTAGSHKCFYCPLLSKT